MKTVSYFLLLASLIFIGCNRNSANDISVEQVSLERNFGNCQAKDGGCLQVNMEYPVIRQGNDSLKMAVNHAVQKFIISTLVMGEVDGENNIVKIDTALIELEEEFRDFLDDLDFAPADWFIESIVGITYMDSSYFALNTSNSSYTGGAHPNAFVS